MGAYEDPATWTPEPVRPRWSPALKFVASLLFIPLLGAFWLKRPPVECETPRRDYRGVGGRYVAEAALAQGWEPRPTDVREEVRLWWSAASRPQDASAAGTARDA
ncbi:hypothetical protein [Streptomyces ardesiacus]|uniref:hypothetical protein n=1 Tax=Streptomyces ardesiacus TaxID=285564 RepID=UPI0036E00E76